LQNLLELLDNIIGYR